MFQVKSAQASLNKAEKRCVEGKSMCKSPNTKQWFNVSSLKWGKHEYNWWSLHVQIFVVKISLGIESRLCYWKEVWFGRSASCASNPSSIGWRISTIWFWVDGLSQGNFGASPVILSLLCAGGFSSSTLNAIFFASTSWTIFVLDLCVSVAKFLHIKSLLSVDVCCESVIVCVSSVNFIHWMLVIIRAWENDIAGERTTTTAWPCPTSEPRFHCSRVFGCSEANVGVKWSCSVNWEHWDHRCPRSLPWFSPSHFDFVEPSANIWKHVIGQVSLPHFVICLCCAFDCVVHLFPVLCANHRAKVLPTFRWNLCRSDWEVCSNDVLNLFWHSVTLDPESHNNGINFLPTKPIAQRSSCSLCCFVQNIALCAVDWYNDRVRIECDCVYRIRSCFAWRIHLSVRDRADGKTRPAPRRSHAACTGSSVITICWTCRREQKVAVCGGVFMWYDFVSDVCF